ncbi:unnamed protein product, partial [Prorocentrum cordatum]
EPSPHCDKALVWRQLARRRYQKTARRKVAWGASAGPPPSPTPEDSPMPRACTWPAPAGGDGAA